MQAVAAGLSGCAGKFRCFLERRVLIAKHLRTQELKNQLKNSRTQELKTNSRLRTQELKKNQQSRAEVRIAAFLHS